MRREALVEKGQDWGRVLGRAWLVVRTRSMSIRMEEAGKVSGCSECQRVENISELLARLLEKSDGSTELIFSLGVLACINTVNHTLASGIASPPVSTGIGRLGP